jgi:hypothetical protein
MSSGVVITAFNVTVLFHPPTSSWPPAHLPTEHHFYFAFLWVNTKLLHLMLVLELPTSSNPPEGGTDLLSSADMF